MTSSLLVYTGRRKTPMPYIRRPEIFCYPFPHMISRTQYKTEFFRFKLMSEPIGEIMQPGVPSLTFEECALARAEELRRLGKEKYFILYSGGIDSTGLLVALLRTWSPEDLAKIVVVLTSHSILENPRFFKDHVVKLRLLNYMTDLAGVLHPSVDPEKSVVITGELGDQLFGSGILMPACRAFGDGILKSDFKDNGAKIIDEYLKADSRRGIRHGEALFEYLQPIADECPFPIRTSFDFFWWFNFTQEWQFAKFKFYESPICPLRTRYGDGIVHFYDSPAFQKWSIEKHDRKIGDSWDSYKQAGKQFIFDFTKDPFHLRQLKLQSLKNTYFFQRFRVAMTDDFKPIEDYDRLEPYARS